MNDSTTVGRSDPVLSRKVKVKVTVLPERCDAVTETLLGVSHRVLFAFS